MGLDDHDVAAFEDSATYTAIDIVQALHPTAHQWTQQHTRVLIKRLA
jgi:hypothetical protein